MKASLLPMISGTLERCASQCMRGIWTISRSRPNRIISFTSDLLSILTARPSRRLEVVRSGPGWHPALQRTAAKKFARAQSPGDYDFPNKETTEIKEDRLGA